VVFNAGPLTTDRTGLGFTPQNQLAVYFNDGSYRGVTTTLFRDYTAWFHVVLSVDTTQAVSTDRIRVWVNGVQQTLTTVGTIPALNAQGYVNAAAEHRVGRDVANNTYNVNGYIAEVHFVDGQALTPSSFGQLDAYGEWQPISYVGTYGTNGFKLNFSDNSAATATTLGKDQAGTNNWTPVNLSVTAGAGNDSYVDSPTSYGTDTGIGGEVRGNYAILNPLHAYLATTTNGSLDCTTSTGWIGSTHHVSTGKWYAEFTVVNANLAQMFGVCTSAHNVTTRPWGTAGAPGVTYYVLDGRVYVNGSVVATVGGAAVGNIISIAFDADTRSVVIRKNNVTITTQTIGVASSYMFYVSDGGTSSTATVNFGQRPFTYTAPSGFKALCDTSLDTGTVATSGTFTGNANANGPFVLLNGVPTAMTINGNAVTFGTHADKLANGFKLRTSSLAYNTSGNNTYSVTTTGTQFKYARAQLNP
jgi:hypothetical protein